jgi:hypothetical protein
MHKECQQQEIAQRLAAEARLAEARQMIEYAVPHRFHEHCVHCAILRVLGGGAKA